MLLPADFPLEKLESAIVKARMTKYRYEAQQDALKTPAQLWESLQEGDKISLEAPQRTVLDKLHQQGLDLPHQQIDIRISRG